MKESQFIKRNQAKWQEIWNSVHFGKSTPDKLADMYLDLTSDLAFAQTNYPDSHTTAYLNDLAFRLHNRIYRKEPFTWKKLVRIWTHLLPRTMYECRKSLLFSFLAFMLFTIIGVFSQLTDENYSRLVLGDEYVDQTLQNIANGQPTHVYNDSPEVTSFVMITYNNLMVDLRTFISGIFTCIGTLVFLFYNGIMLGSFQTFFFQNGYGWESVLAIWQHGALEIPTCILSGAAGITLGNGWLFPGTHSRFEAFKQSAKKGLTMMLGIIPITILAGFIEGFITRHTELPDALRIAAIVVEFTFVVVYFVIYPLRFKHS